MFCLFVFCVGCLSVSVWVFGCFLFVFLLVGGRGGCLLVFLKIVVCGCWGGGGVVCCLSVMETSLHDYQYGLRACFCMHVVDCSRILACTYVCE